MTEDVEQLRQSRDEALAELNKALETLGQLRSDLRQTETVRDNWKAHAISRGKRLRQARDKFINIRDGIEDEGDRVYFGSSNDAEYFKDEVDWLDGFNWSEIMGEPEDWDLLGALDTQKARAISAEKSRDEAVAELSKALETLGQLRSDLQKVEVDRDAARRERETIRKCAHEEGEYRIAENRKLLNRAQSAEASLAKLREAALLAKDTLSKAHNAIRYSEHPAIVALIVGVNATLRSLLDEPDKGQNNAKR